MTLFFFLFRPARPIFQKATTNQFRCSLSTSRKQYEEEYFLHKGLSKSKVEPGQRRKWKQVVNSLNKKWTVPPLELPSVGEYEIKALSKIHKRSYDCNTLLEIRDVRLPSSSHHPSFSRLAKHRLHLIAYTHADMVDKHTRDRVEEWTYKSWPESHPIFVDTRESLSRQIGKPFQIMYDSLLKYLDEKGGLNAALTVGVPNTGKSSLLLCLLQHARNEGFIPKKLKSSPVTKSKKIRRQLGTRGSPQIQDKPGKTRELTEWLLRDKPKAFFLDVPGMTPPKFFFEERPEAWFGMAAANLLPLSKRLTEDSEAQTTICEYVLYCLNRDAHFDYVHKFGMIQPTTDINKVLESMGSPPKTPDDDDYMAKFRLKRCQTFLKLLNTGNLGPVILDDIREPYRPFKFKDEHFERENVDRRMQYDDDLDHDDGSEFDGFFR